MPPSAGLRFRKKEVFPPLMISILVVAIFYADIRLELFVSALYAVVILISVIFYNLRGVLFVAVICAALTILAFAASTQRDMRVASVNTSISLFVMILTTYFAYRSKRPEPPPK